ncbi:signal peptidase I [Streptomyces sp. CAI-21]|uniref:signal peptidase I n=1 Tax=Streptomyces TaxID=1883 RepID=UPI0008F47948|nr:signal peptidase I [Streptomyces albidoflavus]MBO1286718.1 signal peptidase I [Streptomyces sampsonii]NUW10783.1 signal peptidase I [Streptomyces sp. CAI-21]
MDTEAQHQERDRSSTTGPGDNPADPGAEEGSRSSLLSGLPGGRFTLGLGACVVLVLLFSAFVLQPFQIPSRSMEPELRVGDRILVNKLAYRFGGEPRRGDVVVFDGTEYFGDGDFVKRVVGTGGDRVVCCDAKGRLAVNGTVVDEPYLYPGDGASSVPFDVVVPTDRLFLLGDHRSDSSDSRDRLGSPGGGMLPVEQVLGRAEWVGWPFSRWSSVGHSGTLAQLPDRGRHG